MTVAEILENDSWSLAEGEEDGKPLYIRFRGEFRERPDVSAFPRLVRILWSYDADDRGLPTPEAIPRLKDFEQRLVAAVQPGGIGVLVAAVTNNGQREWMFYASGLKAFERALNEIQEGQELYPIDVSSARDPQWSGLHEELLSSVLE